jgi:TRAP-type C4-dicarboxylate transport system substrate-binding protein
MLTLGEAKIMRSGQLLLRSAVALCLLLSAWPGRAMAATEIKIATVAPRGSMWMKALNAMRKKILDKTGGEVNLRFFPGQVQGDERDVVRKMQTEQLHGGAFTAIGLAMINPNVLIMQMPMVFKNYAAVDRVRENLRGDFEKTFRDKGYELLGWGEVGWIHLFTQNKVTSIAELKGQKVWVWNDDPISKAMMKEIGVSPRLLGLPQVLPALNTGIVNAVYNSPLGCMALQWHSKVKYMGAKPVAIGIGATVISKKIFDSLKPEHQKVLKEYGEKFHNLLLKKVRKSNDKALQALKAGGLEIVPLGPKDDETLKNASRKVAKAFSPRYYPQALLGKVMSSR